MSQQLLNKCITVLKQKAKAKVVNFINSNSSKNYRSITIRFIIKNGIDQDIDFRPSISNWQKISTIEENVEKKLLSISEKLERFLHNGVKHGKTIRYGIQVGAIEIGEAVPISLEEMKEIFNR